MTRTGRKISAFAISLLGLAGAQPAAAAKQQRSVAPEAAPPSWLAYAGKVTEQVTGWLQGEDPRATRLRGYLEVQRAAAGDQSASPLQLKLWISRKGMIERIEFSPFADAQPNTDLPALLNGKAIGEAPPKGMLLPLRLAIRLSPAPAPSEGAAGQI